jgi:hypothetical protein
MDNTANILKAIQSLDLSTYPYEKLKGLIASIGKSGGVVNTLHAGKTILRARPNYKGERFNKISEIGYKPAEWNKTYQRASTPYNTMFYGSTISENATQEELQIARIIGVFEAVPFIKDPKSEGEQIITYSKWRVVKDIQLVSIIHHKDFKRENSYAAEQRAKFDKFLADHPKEVGDKARLVTEFFANEFAKDLTPNDYDYMISAIYTELATENGMDGVFYPSVRTGGEGFNVAIHPRCIDNKFIVPEVVGECTMYKRGQNSFVDNDTIVELKEDQEEFEYGPVEAKYHAGRDKMLKNLYPEKY